MSFCITKSFFFCKLRCSLIVVMRLSISEWLTHSSTLNAQGQTKKSPSALKKSIHIIIWLSNRFSVTDHIGEGCLEGVVEHAILFVSTRVSSKGLESEVEVYSK